MSSSTERTLYLCNMTDPRQIRIQDFTYDLPESRIAKYPLANRSDAKCLILDSERIESSHFWKVADALSPNSILVVNNAKVIQARLLFSKSKDSKPIEIFCLEPHGDSVEQAMQTMHRVDYTVLIGGVKKWKSANPLSIPYADDRILKAYKVTQLDGVFVITFEWNSDHTFAELLEILGHTPIPPYLRRADAPTDKERYQTVFAETPGSVAAPTAGLHFTPDLLQTIQNKGVQIEKVTLHVGAGTFKPVSAETMQGHLMHVEPISVPLSLLERLLSSPDSEIVALGTTSVRTLESIYWMGAKLMEGASDWHHISQWTPYDCSEFPSLSESIKALINYLIDNKLAALTGTTQLIIAPGYFFRVVDRFFTNFHQPGSTLLLLVAAAVGDQWKEIYTYALQHDFRFLSYGDGSLLQVHPNNLKK
jgi:S-adenosylmethionine:tRNA ribosyltransferase-isomerase